MWAWQHLGMPAAGRGERTQRIRDDLAPETVAQPGRLAPLLQRGRPDLRAQVGLQARGRDAAPRAERGRRVATPSRRTTPRWPTSAARVTRSEPLRCAGPRGRNAGASTSATASEAKKAAQTMRLPVSQAASEQRARMPRRARAARAPHPRAPARRSPAASGATIARCVEKGPTPPCHSRSAQRGRCDLPHAFGGEQPRAFPRASASHQMRQRAGIARAASRKRPRQRPDRPIWERSSLSVYAKDRRSSASEARRERAPGSGSDDQRARDGTANASSPRAASKSERRQRPGRGMKLRSAIEAAKGAKKRNSAAGHDEDVAPDGSRIHDRNGSGCSGIGAPDTIRTCDPCLRRAVLYPAELRARMCRILNDLRPRVQRWRYNSRSHAHAIEEAMSEHHHDPIEDNIETHPVKLAIGDRDRRRRARGRHRPARAVRRGRLRQPLASRTIRR